MLKLTERCSNANEIASVIVSAINKVGVEQTLLSLSKPMKKKDLDKFKLLLKQNDSITFKLYEQVKKSKIPKYIVTVDVLTKQVDVFDIPRDIDLCFEEFTFERANTSEDS
jgi:hypothetical protein